MHPILPPSSRVLPQGAVPPVRFRSRHLVDRPHLGVTPRTRLRGMGWSDWDIRQAVRHTVLLPLAAGWFADSRADARIVSALHVGARLTCLDAAKLHGLWVPESSSRSHQIGRAHV